MVKDALRRQAVRLCEVDAEARPQIEEWFARGVFGKRAQKAFIKHSEIEQSQGDRSVANGQS
jgi:hypothetical protein